MLRIGRVTVAYTCLEMVAAACGSLRLPNLAIMYLVAHYAWIEHSVSSASNHYMTDTWVLRATLFAFYKIEIYLKRLMYDGLKLDRYKVGKLAIKCK